MIVWLRKNFGFVAFFIVVACLIVSARFFLIPVINENLDDGSGPLPDTKGVEKVVDGDTLVMEDGSVIRLLCINTQEKGQVWADEATQRLKEFVAMGEVTLETDTTDKDASGRLLRFVFVEDANGTKINVCLEMVREGLANAYVWWNTEAFKDLYFAAEQEARENERGYWQSSEYDIEVIGINNAAGGDEHVTLFNNGSTVVCLDSWTIKEQHSQFILARFFLESGATVRLHTYSGADNETDIFMNRSHEFWSDKGDAVFLRDGNGLMADFMEYGDRVIG